MLNVNFAAVAVAGVASFVASGIWYAVLGDKVAHYQEQWRGAQPQSGRPMAVEMATFFVVALVVALVVAILLRAGDVSGLGPAVGFGVLLWVGFCLTQWVSSVMGENVPIQLAAVHAGDWLLRVVIISAIVSIWR